MCLNPIFLFSNFFIQYLEFPPPPKKKTKTKQKQTNKKQKKKKNIKKTLVSKKMECNCAIYIILGIYF